MNLFAISSLLCAVFCIVLALFSFLAGKGKAYRLLGWFHFAVAIWGTGCYFVAISNSPANSLIGWKIAFLGGLWIAPVFYHLTSVLTDTDRKKIIVASYLQALIFDLLIFTPLFLNSTRPLSNLFYAKITPLLSIAIFIYLILVLCSYFNLFRCHRSKNGLKKYKIKLLLWGFSFGFVSGTVTLLPVFKLDFMGVYLGNIGIFISAAVQAYALLRHKFLDLEEFAEAAHRDKLAAIGTLATSMNHEIRNPLYVIQGLADTYLINYEEGIYSSSDHAVQKANEVLTKTRDQAMRAMDIMKRFAMFAKQDVSKEPEAKPVCIQRVLEDVLPLIRHEMELEKIDLQQNVPTDLAPLRADRRHLEEILFNLIVNACQALKGTSFVIASDQRAGSSARGRIRLWRRSNLNAEIASPLKNTPRNDKKELPKMGRTRLNGCGSKQQVLLTYSAE